MKKCTYDKDKILENYVEPDIVVQYLFIERAENQIKAINDDQGNFSSSAVSTNLNKNDSK
jgi:hypothetical protein